MRIENKPTKTFEQCPAGTQCARLIHILDLGTQKTVFQGVEKDKRQCRLTWELVDAPMEDGRNFVIGKTYNSSLYKSSLLEAIESMTGKAITFEADGSFEMGQLLGMPCMLTVVHTSKDGKNYSNIGSLSPMPSVKGKLIEAELATNHLLNFSLDEFDQTTFDMIPKWIQETIRKAPEFSQDIPF